MFRSSLFFFLFFLFFFRIGACFTSICEYESPENGMNKASPWEEGRRTFGHAKSVRGTRYALCVVHVIARVTV
jgi:hypothetical protein